MDREAIHRDDIGEEPIAAARALGPTIRESAETAGKARKIPTSVCRAIGETGAFRILQPRRFGGYGPPPGIGAAAAMESAPAIGTGAALKAARTLLFSQLDRSRVMAFDDGRPPDAAGRIGNRIAQAHSIRLALRGLDEIWCATGADGVHDARSVQRARRAAHLARHPCRLAPHPVQPGRHVRDVRPALPGARAPGPFPPGPFQGHYRTPDRTPDRTLGDRPCPTSCA